MIGAALALFRALNGPRWAAVAGVLLALILAVGGVYMAGVSAGRAAVSADRDAWRATARGYLASAKEWEASFRASERYRGDERAAAGRAVNASEKACDARVSVARRSAAAIQSIVTKEVRYDESHCPVRAVVSSGELRDALGLIAGR